MSDDTSKAWKTVKIPEADKTHAEGIRPDPATYGDCMRAGADFLAAIHGDKDIDDVLDAWNGNHLVLSGHRTADTQGVDVEELVTKLEDALDTASMADDPGTRVGEELSETLREIREGLSTVEERTGRVERTLEDMGARR